MQRITKVLWIVNTGIFEPLLAQLAAPLNNKVAQVPLFTGVDDLLGTVDMTGLTDSIQDPF